MTTELSPKTVDNLEVILPHLSEKQEAEFRFLVSRYKRSWDNLQELQNYINEQTITLRVDLDQALTDYQQIENEITQTRDWISSDKNSLPIIIGRIQVMLSDPRLNLPFPIRWLKRFALHTHPNLTPLFENKSIIEKELDHKKQEYSKNLTKFHEDKKEDLDLVTHTLQTSGNFVLAFCDELSATSLELAEKYIRVIPNRADKVARDYVEKNISSDWLLDLFPTFINHIHTILIDDTAIRAAKRRYGNFLGETTVPTYNQFLALPPSAQRRFKEFAIFKITTDWAQQGFIDQPQLPDILRMP